MPPRRGAGGGAGDDAPFTALGRIEIDQEALTASLNEAEGKVRASVDRQAESFASFSTRAKKAMDQAALRSAIAARSLRLRRLSVISVTCSPPTQGAANSGR